MSKEVLKEIDENYPDELLSRSQYAARKGVAGRTIGKYVQAGVIPLWDNKIWPEEADKCLDDYLIEPLGSGRRNMEMSDSNNNNNNKSDTVTAPKRRPNLLKPKKPKNTYTEARTVEKNLKIELLKLDVALKKGKMILAEDVEQAAYSAARMMRDRMLNIPDRVASVIAAETDEVKVREYITDQIESELTTILQEKFDYSQLED